MRVIDLSEENLEAYLHCLEPWSAEIADGVQRKRTWYEAKKDRGLIVKLVADDDGEIAGMIQALPIEQTGLQGENLHFILCIWVHAHTEGIGDRRGHGIGTMLLEAVEAEARAAGAKGIAAWGMALPFWMRASWFRKHGYRKVDRRGVASMVFKPFEDDVPEPAWPAARMIPDTPDDQVTVTCVDGGWCTLQNANCVRARRAAIATGAEIVEIDTSDPATVREWGEDYGIWVDDCQLAVGPPLSEERVRARIRARQRGPWWRRLTGAFTRPPVP